MEEVVQLSHKQFLRIDKDYEKTATVAELVYVSDQQPGITRLKKGKGFTYIYDSKPLKGREQMERIRKLAIPPSWTNVWICKLPNGHIQATGLDLRQRKQYKYHALWHSLRNETKFHRLYEFGKALPQLRLAVEKDLSSRELTQEKVLATLISLMERTYIRIGSSDYEKMYGSYGLTTLKDRHVTIKGDRIMFTFKGKKGIFHNVTLRSRRLAKAVEACRDLAGKELFQYIGPDGNRCPVDSGHVNGYIKAGTGGDFSSKDFRTWAGSINILRAFKSIGEAATEADCRKNIISAIDDVSKKLGNSRSICKKYYVHPALIRLYEENNLSNYLAELDKIEGHNDRSGLTPEEQVLMKILSSMVK